MKREGTIPSKRSARAQVAAATSPDGSGELARDLAHLHALLEREDVEGARAFVSELETRWPGSDRVRHCAQVLAPPRVTIRHGQRGRSRQRERVWLREHAREYPGRWLALLEDHLILADPDLDAVLTAVRQTPGAQRALLHFQPGEPD